MNATETIFALALASNDHAQQHIPACLQQLEQLGCLTISPIYLIPCRDGIGADYWNMACLLKSTNTPEEILQCLKQLEQTSGRMRPSHQISLDIDLIAWGKSLSNMQFNPQKLPLALDVKVPLAHLWNNRLFDHAEHDFPILEDIL